MNEDTSARHVKEALSGATPKFESRHEIFDYLLKEACRRDLEGRERVLRDYYVNFLGIERADRKKQENELAGCAKYQKDLVDMRAGHESKADFLKRTLDEARGESLQQLTEGLQKLSDRESDAKKLEKTAREQAQSYEAELKRVDGYEAKIKKRDDELKALQGDLEKKSMELSEGKRLLHARKEAVEALEKTLGEQANELHDAMPHLRTFLKFVETKGTAFYTMLDEMVKYYEKILKNLPVVQVPPPPKPK